MSKSYSSGSLSDSSESEKKVYRLYNENNILIDKKIVQSILKKGVFLKVLMIYEYIKKHLLIKHIQRM